MQDLEWGPLREHPEWIKVEERWKERRKRLQSDLKEVALLHPERVQTIAARLDELEMMMGESSERPERPPSTLIREYAPDRNLY